MSEGSRSKARGRFKGKKISFASTARVEEFAVVASDFMEELFELLPGEYLISDESDLMDFTYMGSSDTSGFWKRIKEVYGIELIDVGSERLVDIFAEIVRRKSVH